MEDYIEHSGSRMCRICLEPYPQKENYCQKKISDRSIGFVIIAIIAIYTIAGIAGQIIFDELTHTTVEIKPPWHLKHVLAAMLVTCLICFTYAFVRRTRMLL